MKDQEFAAAIAHALDNEYRSTHKCLERIPMELADWKPHERSMAMGYLAQLVAEIPRWINVTLREGDIDFATYRHNQPKTTEELVKLFEDNVADAKAALAEVKDGDLSKPFHLKNKGQILMTTTAMESIGQDINHMVHHRGQLTVYMRLNDIDVPSIYGPSADDKSYG